MDAAIKTFQEWIDESNSITFFSGMGVSLDSGIPDFRKMEDGHMATYGVPPETIFTRDYFERRPGPFFRYYRDKMLGPLLTAEPNATHHKLLELEAAGKLRMILTQNMDDLHQEAGSKKVIELYGSVMRNDCHHCERRYATLDIYEKPGIPYCDVDMCGKVIGPDIILYGDPLPTERMADAIYHAMCGDMLIVAGTSLQEYPAAAIVHYYMGKKMVLINPEPTPLDSRADLLIHAPIHEVMSQIKISPRSET